MPELQPLVQSYDEKPLVQSYDEKMGGIAMAYIYLNNAQHWRDRAEETRAKAEQCWKEESKQRMLRIANEYDRLADHAAERLRADELPVQK